MIQNSPPRLNGMRGQTSKMLVLADDRILCLYRRDDEPGLWANLVRIDGVQWVNLEQAPVWQGAGSGMTGTRGNMEELGDLQFGFPSMLLMPDNQVYAVFWCCESGIYNIRWCRIRING